MNREDSDFPGSRPVSVPEPDASVVGLIRQLSREVPALFTKKLALAKAELQASLTTLRAGIAGVAGGAIVLRAGFISLLMSAVYGLSIIMAPWLAALIVGVVVMIVGFAKRSLASWTAWLMFSVAAPRLSPRFAALPLTDW